MQWNILKHTLTIFRTFLYSTQYGEVHRQNVPYQIKVRPNSCAKRSIINKIINKSSTTDKSGAKYMYKLFSNLTTLDHIRWQTGCKPDGFKVTESFFHSGYKQRQICKQNFSHQLECGKVQKFFFCNKATSDQQLDTSDYDQIGWKATVLSTKQHSVLENVQCCYKNKLPDNICYGKLEYNLATTKAIRSLSKYLAKIEITVKAPQIAFLTQPY